MIDDIIIDEVFEFHMNETYKSVQEVKQLAADVIKNIAENNMQ